MIRWLTLLPLLLSGVCSQAQTAAGFFVAVNGNDGWSGRWAQANAAKTDGPFATLARARDAVRELKKVSASKDIVVRIRGGLYRLPETLVFSLEDSAPTGGTITYAAYPEETPVLSSGVPIRSCRKLSESPANLPAAARGQVWVAEAPKELSDFFTMYEGDQRLPRARGQGFGPADFVDVKTSRADQLKFPPGAMRNWPGLQDAELLVIPTADYEMCILPLAAVDEAAGLATTAVPASRPMGKVKFFPVSAWAENILEVLDQPGEWVFSRAERKIYLWPRGAQPG